jgi:Na+/H+ antiporter NhaD/arsenite permease-like protein
MSLQYGALQQMLFVMGIMMGMGVITETGVWGDVATWLDDNVHDVWMMGIGAGLLSCIVDSFTIAISNISLFQVGVGDIAVNGAYWSIIAFSTAVGGCLLSVGSISGIALMKMEHVSLGWYVKHLTPKVLLGWIVGYVILWLELNVVSF